MSPLAKARNTISVLFLPSGCWEQTQAADDQGWWLPKVGGSESLIPRGTGFLGSREAMGGAFQNHESSPPEHVRALSRTCSG